LDRKTKEQVVEELHEKLKHFNLAVLTNCSGLNVEKITTLRNALRKTDTEFRVVKNTLLRIASKETDLSGMQEHFKGPLAIALNYSDVVDTAKVLIDFAKKNADLEIRAGMLNGKVITGEQLNHLATLPSREVLLGKLLSVFVGVQTGFVSVLSAVPRSMVQVVEAYRLKKEKTN
jgi:large subunit ribosomal protein L10